MPRPSRRSSGQPLRATPELHELAPRHLPVTGRFCVIVYDGAMDLGDEFDLRKCVVCTREFRTVKRRGRPPLTCSEECRLIRVAQKKTTAPCQRPNAICVDCGGACRRSTPKGDWTPPPEPRCQPCWVKSRKPDPALTTCGCGETKYRDAQTCLKCLREAQRTHRIAHPAPNSHARGYTRKHKRLRQAWATIIELSDVLCARCRCPITTEDAWHLDHDDDDRSKYLGPSHSRCNLSAPKKQRSKHLFSVKDPA
jgi:hypothetical protein